MKQNNFAFNISVFFLISLIIFTPIYNTLSSAKTLQPGDCEKELAASENNYREGSFDEALQILIRSIHKQGCNKREKALAYKLLGKVYIAKNYLGRARLALRKMIEMDANLVLDPRQEPPSLISLYDEVRKKLQRRKQRVVVTPKQKTRKGGTKLWPWLLGSGVAGGIAVFMVFGGGSGDGDRGIGARGFPRPVGRPNDD